MVLVLVSCGPATVSDLERCVELSSTGQTVSTGAPSKVSLFFGAQTCGGDPLPSLTADDFEVKEDGVPLSPFESRVKIAPKGEKFRLESVLLLDLSGSILRSGQFPALDVAVQKYLEAAVRDGHELSLYTFDGREKPQALTGFTSDKAVLLEALKSLQSRECNTNADCNGRGDAKTCAVWRCVDDSTNLNGAVVEGLGALDARMKALSDVQLKESALVVFTDGADLAARVDAATVSTAVQQSKSRVFTVGLGDGANSRALKEIGRDGHFAASRPEELSGAFATVADRLSGMANRYYRVEYCSPKRSGVHKVQVTVRAEREGARYAGSISGEFDASGFSSGCEL